MGAQIIAIRPQGASPTLGAQGEGAPVTGRSGHSASKLRLTRRGRAFFGAIATVLVAGLLAWIAALAAPQALASDVSADGQSFHYAIMQPGESLWTLATELDDSTDPRDLVSEIIQLNQLEGADVQAGQPLAVPLRYSDHPTVVSSEELGIDQSA